MSEHWDQMRDEWIGVEGYKDPLVWLPRFASIHGVWERLKPEERAALEGLPDPATLYRGTTLEHARGMSWTDEKNQAARFARKRGGVVITAIVPKQCILAYFGDQHEYEVVIDPTGVEYKEFPMTAEELNRLADEAIRQGKEKSDLEMERELRE